MRGYECYIYHLQKNNKLIKNSNNACWAGVKYDKYLGKDIYIDKYIEPEITDKQRKRIIYLLNKITPCKFKTIKNVKYIQFKLLKYHYSNLLLLNFIRILWYKNKAFNNEQFFIDICKPKTKGLDIRLKIFYFTLEMTAEQKMLSAFSNILYIKEGVRIAPKDLRSNKEDKILSQTNLDLISKYESYFRKIEEIVEFIDDIRNPYGIYTTVRDYALANGKIHTRKIETKPGIFIEVEDYYEANDPEEYVIIIVDHISLIQPEKNRDTGLPMTLHESIGKLSSDYLIKLRNRFKYIPVVVQQQAQAQESIENKKYNKLKPSLDGLGDNKMTQRDFDYILGLFSPFRHEIPEYMGYDITKFRDNIRFLEILGGREGGGGTICPLYFDGAVNYFKELPHSNNTEELNKVYQFMKNIKK